MSRCKVCNELVSDSDIALAYPIEVERDTITCEDCLSWDGLDLDFQLADGVPVGVINNG